MNDLFYHYIEDGDKCSRDERLISAYATYANFQMRFSLIQYINRARRFEKALLKLLLRNWFNSHQEADHFGSTKLNLNVPELNPTARRVHYLNGGKNSPRQRRRLRK